MGRFACGTPSLDEWLKRRAMANQISGASRTYVVTDISQGSHTVVGYYCLASGALAVIDAPGTIRRNMPDPIPMAVLGRLAVDSAWHGKRLGVALLQDAVDGATLVGRLATVYAEIGDTDRAVEHLEKAAVLPHSLHYGDLKLDERFDPIRKYPRFEKILAALAPKE